MNRNKAILLAKDLIDNYCKDYYFKFDMSKRRFGYCNIKHKIISLSLPLILLNNEKEVRDTILHEIAHAITKEGHTKKFYNCCTSIGADATRCYSKDIIRPKIEYKYTYIYECPNCKKTITRNRKTKYACSICCDKYNNRKYSDKFRFRLVETTKRNNQQKMKGEIE